MRCCPTAPAISDAAPTNAGPYGAVVWRQNGDTAPNTCPWPIAPSASGACV